MILFVAKLKLDNESNARAFQASSQRPLALGLRWQATARHRFWMGFLAGTTLARNVQPHASRASEGGVALSLPAALQGPFLSPRG